MAGAERMTIEEVVRQVLRDEYADVIRESVRAVARELMEVEVSELVGAELGERRPDDRATQRNGYRVARAADQQERGVAHRWAARRAGRGVPAAAARGPLPVRVR